MSILSRKAKKMHTPLAEAAEYNLFTRLNAVLNQSDIGGRAAIGGDTVFTDLTLGRDLCTNPLGSCPPYGTDASLVAGGNVSWHIGTNYSGNTVMLPHTSYQAKDIVYKNADHLLQPVRLALLPVNFDKAFCYLECLSEEWANACNFMFMSKVYQLKGHIILIGLSKCLNIFYLPEDVPSECVDISAPAAPSCGNIRSITIITPPGSTSLINIPGHTVAFDQLTVLRRTDTPSLLSLPFLSRFSDIMTGSITDAADSKLILWNFYEAEHVNITNTSLPGTLLAPRAEVLAGGSRLYGTVIAQTFEAGILGLRRTELHNCPFEGSLPKAYACRASSLCPPCPPFPPCTTTTHCTTTTPCTTTTHCTTTTPCTTTTRCTTTTPCTTTTRCTTTTPCTTTTRCTTTTPCTTTTRCTTTTPCTTTTRCTTTTPCTTTTRCTTTTPCTTTTRCTTTRCTTSTTRCTTTRCTTSTTYCPFYRCW